MKPTTLLAGFVGVLLAGGVVWAGQQGSVTIVPPPPSGISGGLAFDSSWRPNGIGGTQIVGSVIDIRQIPVARVSVRLRNLSTGEVVAVSESDASGAYEFPDVEPGTYVVEMYMNGQYVVALSNAGSIARNETLQTVVMLTGRWDASRQDIVPTQDYAAFGGRSAATTMAGTTINAAATENIPPVSPGEPVSPNTTK